MYLPSGWRCPLCVDVSITGFVSFPPAVLLGDRFARLMGIDLAAETREITELAQESGQSGWDVLTNLISQPALMSFSVQRVNWNYLQVCPARILARKYFCSWILGSRCFCWVVGRFCLCCVRLSLSRLCSGYSCSIKNWGGTMCECLSVTEKTSADVAFGRCFFFGVDERVVSCNC